MKGLRKRHTPPGLEHLQDPGAGQMCAGVGPTGAALRPGCSCSALLCPAPPPDLPNRLFSSPSASREVRSELRAWGSGRRAGRRQAVWGCAFLTLRFCCPTCRLIGVSVWQPGAPTLALLLSELGGFYPTPPCADEKTQGRGVVPGHTVGG